MPVINEKIEEQQPFPIAIVVSSFNQDITKALLKGTINRLNSLGFNDSYITIVEVPGAIEIPLVAKKLAQKDSFGAIITLGAVIRGETTHYDYVCEQVSRGCQDVMMTYELPVVFGVLTTENESQAWDRLGGNHGHKGADAADCALIMRKTLDEIQVLTI